jgi:hypothetical protein
MKNFLPLCSASFAVAAWAMCATSSLAADTAVNCTAPVVQLNMGTNGVGGPRVTIFCSGGVFPVTPIVYYAYAYNTNSKYSAALGRSVAEAVGFNQVAIGPGATIVIYSNFDAPLPDGCGNANCRSFDTINPQNDVMP